MKSLLISLLLILSGSALSAQTAAEIIQKSEDVLRGSSNIVEMKMIIERPKWSREMVMKAWNKGEDLSLILIKSPARDEGTTFLKRDKEIWNYVPNIERVVKMPPAMMMQSWMGSDFTNDDLVRNSSVIEDYDQEIVGEEEIDGRMCYVIELVPKEDAPVLWGMLKTWITKEDFLQMRLEFYDEDEDLVNRMVMSDIKEMDGKLLPSKMTITPEEDPESKTIIEYIDMQFDEPIEDEFFSVQTMKRIRE